MKLTTPMTITAADSDTRIISGRIVAFEEPANASTGKVIFAKGSIQPSPVKLNLEHDRTRPIGKTLEMTLNENSIDASFKISNTTAGSDAIAEAMDGLRDGFSIELAVDEYVMEKDGTMRVLMGELTGVALVTEPAVRSARVSDVAATEGEEIAEEDRDEGIALSAECSRLAREKSETAGKWLPIGRLEWIVDSGSSFDIMSPHDLSKGEAKEGVLIVQPSWHERRRRTSCG